MCDVKRCRHEATVGVLPRGFSVARFLCKTHWRILCEGEGSVCEKARGLSFKS